MTSSTGQSAKPAPRDTSRSSTQTPHVHRQPQPQSQAQARTSIQLQELQPGAVPAADALILWNEHLIPEALDDPRPSFMDLLPRTGTRAVQV